MIPVTRLNGAEIYVNCDQIVTMEDTPDTLLIFNNGERMLVKEQIADVLRRIVAFKRRLNMSGVE